MLKTLFKRNRKPKGLEEMLEEIDLPKPQLNEHITIFPYNPEETRPPGIYTREISPGVWSVEVVRDPNVPFISKETEDWLMNDVHGEANREAHRKMIDRENARYSARHGRGKER